VGIIMKFDSLDLKNQVANILGQADVKINGTRPWDVKILDDNIYKRLLSQGMLGVGEGYMAEEWECDSIDELTFRALTRIGSVNKVDFAKKNFTFLLRLFFAKFINFEGRNKDLEVVKKHYDIGNDLFLSFLDPYNQYTCGYFKDTKDLNVAQEQKLDLICKKLHLSSKDKVLDIGCGWGGFGKYAASHYGCSVTGITISKEQAKYAREFTKGLPVKILVQDYRDLKGKYDKILVCGMIEHVGYKNYRTYMEVVDKNLKEDGIFLLHTIGSITEDDHDPNSWIRKYIFPNGMLPTVELIAKSVEGLFVMEDVHNFGAYYDKTLMAWFHNFDENWYKIKNKYTETTYRMFKFYFLTCAGAFRARQLQLWQIVFSKKGIVGGYSSVR